MVKVYSIYAHRDILYAHSIISTVGLINTALPELQETPELMAFVSKSMLQLVQYPIAFLGHPSDFIISIAQLVVSYGRLLEPSGLQGVFAVRK